MEQSTFDRRSRGCATTPNDCALQPYFYLQRFRAWQPFGRGGNRPMPTEVGSGVCAMTRTLWAREACCTSNSLPIAWHPAKQRQIVVICTLDTADHPPSGLTSVPISVPPTTKTCCSQAVGGVTQNGRRGHGVMATSVISGWSWFSKRCSSSAGACCFTLTSRQRGGPARRVFCAFFSCAS